MNIASRKFSAAEARWRITHKALGIISGLEENRRFVLGAAHVTLRTDHSSLQWLREAKTARRARRLSEYEFGVVHRLSPSHAIVDAFTRVFPEDEAAATCWVIRFRSAEWA